VQYVQTDTDAPLQAVRGLHPEDGPPLQLAGQLYGVQELQILPSRVDACR
jgi:hypothetical protein